MTIRQVVHHDWTKVVAIIVTLVSLALAAEHRQTLVEEAVAANVETIKVIKDRQDKTDDLILQIQLNQMKVVTLLDEIDKRHSLEDQKRLR